MISSKDNESFGNNLTNKIEYENYDELQEFPEDEDFDTVRRKVTEMINDEESWMNQYEGLNDLRRLNKYSPIVFNTVLPNTIKQIAKLTASIRSNLSKLALMLIREIFVSQNLSTNNLKGLKILVTSVMAQTATMKSFIREEALQSLNNLSSNCYFFSTNTLQILIEEVTSKTLQQSETAFNTIIRLFENWSKEDIFSGTNYAQWEVVCHGVLILYAMKREPYIKRACKIIESIYSKFGDEDFQNVLNAFKTEEYNKNLLIKMIQSAIDTKKKSKPTENIRDVLNKLKNK